MQRKKQTISVLDGKLQSSSRFKQFYLQFLTDTQKQAYEEFTRNTILFLVGQAGSGKTHLAIAFAIKEILENSKEKILLSRPVVEAGENLGFLPGDIDEKVYPYMLPLYDCLDTLCGKTGTDRREYIDKRTEVAPVAFLRGRTFNNSICILDEAQNCTVTQIKLFLTRLGTNSKMIITGDPSQSDLQAKKSDLLYVIDKLKGIHGVEVVFYDEKTIVRHPLVTEIVKLI